MKKTVFYVIAGVLATCTSVPAFAQERSDASYAREVSIGYSFLRDVGVSGKMGMLVDFGKQLNSHTSLVGEFAVNHFGYFEETYSQVAGGVRFGTVASPRVRPFFQVMGGVQHDFGSNGYLIQPGGGVSLRLGKRVDAKLQVDAPIVTWEGKTYKQFRLNVGLGLPLGR